jgi:hypothetical protein
MSSIENNIRAYKLFFEIEVALREFLIARCEPIGGPKWYRDVLAQAQAAKLERLIDKRNGGSPAELRAKDDKKAWVSRRAFHPVYFVDFPELGGTFRMKSNASLGSYLVSRSAVAIADHVDRLSPARNAVAHNRHITLGDLQLVESIHAQIRADLGATYFEQLIACPSVSSSLDEMAELRAELIAAIASMKQGLAIQLRAWPRLRQRWWLEPDWQLDSESVVEAFDAIEKYGEHWSEEYVGRKRRMQEWVAAHWRESVGQRAVASLDRDEALGNGGQ